MSTGSAFSLPRTAYLGLGSNLGDRDANLRAALHALAQHMAIRRVSDVYDTAPVLYTQQPRFHNLVAEVHTTLAPEELLHRAKDIERKLGREAGPRYGPRPIDIDILLYGDLVIARDDLVIPHPRMAERAFVLLPLRELAPDLIHPTRHQTIAALAAHIPPDDAQRLGALPAAEG